MVSGPMRYRFLLADNDNTLMDFDAAERQALTETLTALGLPADEAVCRRYQAINDALWKALERGETTQKALKVERFSRLLGEMDVRGVTAQAAAERYARQLSTHADMMPGAMDFLRRVAGKMKIALVSNGVSAIQRGRLARCPFAGMLDAVIISEEVGVSKPDPAMVDLALEALGCEDRAQAILLGDSLTADIPAARAAGIHSILLNLRGVSTALPTYTVSTLGEAADILLGEERK